MTGGRATDNPVRQFARVVLEAGAPPGIVAWARGVLRARGEAPGGRHLLADQSGRVVGRIDAARPGLHLGPNAPTVLLRPGADLSHPTAHRPAIGWAGLWGLLAIGIAGSAVAQTPAAPTIHVQTFDRAWTIVYESHFDTTFNGVDWVALRDELRPRALAAETRREIRSVIGEMLDRLGQSHFALIPAEAVDDDGDEPGESSDATSETRGAGDVGLDLRLVGDRVMITSVERGGPAEAAGIRTGWIVRAIDGRSSDSLVARARAVEAIGPVGIRVWARMLGRLGGRPGSEVKLDLLDGDDRPVSVSLERRVEPSEPVRFGNLPTFHSRFAGRTVGEPPGIEVGLVWFNFWMVPLVRQVDSALFAARELDGVVIDLRGNRGGVGAMVIGVAGHFFEERVSMGTFATRTSRLEIRANPRRVTPDGRPVAPYGGPVAILVDETSGSASELFAGGMQAVGRARVFGETTAGAVLPAASERLPNDDLLYHAFADFVTPDSVRLEGRGVIPDEPIVPTRAALLEDRDEVLEAAVRWIAMERNRRE